MTPYYRPRSSQFDLSGWDRLPKRHEPLAGQMDLFQPTSSVLKCDTPSFQSRGQTVLFDSGCDLPGASERAQSILWDVA